MTNKELNKLAMLYAIQTVFAKNTAIVKTNPALDETSGNFNNALSTILARDNEYRTIKSGAVAAKDFAVNALISICLLFANALFSLGRKINDEELKAECELTPTYFNYLRERELEQKCIHLLDLARLHANELAAYNLDVNTFETALATYRTRSGMLPQKKAVAKASRKSLTLEFRKANEILKKDIDKLIELVKESAPDFYNEYKAALVTVNYRARHSSGNGKTEETAPAITAGPPSVEVKLAA